MGHQGLETSDYRRLIHRSAWRDCLESSRTGRTARLSVWPKVSKRASLIPSRRLVRPQMEPVRSF
jgi:hypothetical protein